MNMIATMKQRRSIRKFAQTPIDGTILRELVDVARLAPYPMNLQPLKFAIVDTPKDCHALYAYTKWAGYLTNGAPSEDERPLAYIVILCDVSIKANGDFGREIGIAGSHLVLGAATYGIASCWLGALDRARIAALLDLPTYLSVGDVIALGYPKQESKAVPLTNDVKYFYDHDGVLNVPKRRLEDVIYQRKELS